MNFLEAFELAFRNILAGKMRAFLTMLGIIIGVTAVIIIVGIGNGLEKYMVDQFQSMGTNTLNVSITGRGSSRRVTADDMYGIVADNPQYLAFMTPNVFVNGSVKIGSETLSRTSASGIGEDYFTIKKYTVAEGRGIFYADIANRSNICVVGSYVARELFNGNAMDKTLKIGGRQYQIVGVLDEIADSTEGSTDDAVYLPYSTAVRQSGTEIRQYTIMVVSEDTASESKKAVEDALYAIFGSSDAYGVTSMTEMMDMMSQMLNVVISILTVIAGISLAVGGIGIMNIMLVSVTERTREIGIRKALGAKQRYIMSQFVIEAATTSAIGGIIGIALGYVLSSLATQIIAAVLDASVVVTPTTEAITVAFGISAFIGVLFGYLPAKKAAHLNPIDALRYE